MTQTISATPQKSSMHEDFRRVLQRITQAEQRYGRPPGSVRLLAVSKTRSEDEIRALAHQGQTAFGENYLQEAEPKIAALRSLGLEWHFIGSLQSRKIPRIAERFDWVQTIDRASVAHKLDQNRDPSLGPLQVCIQVNVSGEVSKSGCAPHNTPELAERVADLPNLKLRGLMVIPARETDPERQRRVFRRVNVLYQELKNRGLALDTLSMGMSADLEAAIAEQATLVRVGTALFGPRPHQQSKRTIG